MQVELNEQVLTRKREKICVVLLGLNSFLSSFHILFYETLDMLLKQVLMVQTFKCEHFFCKIPFITRHIWQNTAH